jgi:DNA-directed RNA polymerase specialized sigma24 family protein
LLERVAKGDDTSWEEFYSRYARLIDWFCRERAVPPMTSREERLLVIQAVMVFFHKSGYRYDVSRGASFRSYLLGVTRNKVREVWRELHPAREVCPEPSDPDGGPSIVESMTDPAGCGDGRERHEWLLRLIEQLRADPSVSPLHCRVLGLLLEGVQPQEICKETGLTTNHLYVIKHRLVRRLRQLDSQETIL